MPADGLVVSAVVEKHMAPTRDKLTQMQRLEAIRQELVVQVTSAVRWSDSVRTMADSGCSVFVELGPGQVLSGLIRRIAKEAVVLNVGDEASLESAAEKLGSLI